MYKWKKMGVFLALILVGLVLPLNVSADSTKFDNIRTGVISVSPSTIYGYYGYHVFAAEGGIFEIDPSDVTISTMDTWLGPE